MSKLEHATFFNRTAAFTIDMVTIVMFQVVLGSLTVSFYQIACLFLKVQSLGLMEVVLQQMCWILCFFGYFPFATSLFGNTLGKHLLQIQAVTDQDQKYINGSQAFLRSLGYVLSSSTYMVGFVLPLFRKDKKSLHDLICNTHVLQHPRTITSDYVETSDNTIPFPTKDRKNRSA